MLAPSVPHCALSPPSRLRPPGPNISFSRSPSQRCFEAQNRHQSNIRPSTIANICDGLGYARTVYRVSGRPAARRAARRVADHGEEVHDVVVLRAPADRGRRPRIEVGAQRRHSIRHGHADARVLQVGERASKAESVTRQAVARYLGDRRGGRRRATRLGGRQLESAGDTIRRAT